MDIYTRKNFIKIKLDRKSDFFIIIFMKKRTLMIVLFVLVLKSFIFAQKNKIENEMIEWGVISTSFIFSEIFSNQKPYFNPIINSSKTNLTYKNSTIPMSWLRYYALFNLGLIGFTPNKNGNFNDITYQNLKGFSAALTLTLFTTSLTKNIFGKKRPSYNNYPESAKNKDGRKSFFSGHSSFSFCVATYISFYLFNHISTDINDYIFFKLSLSVSLHILAGYVAYTRVDDHKHFASDVIIGGLVGSGIAYLTYSFFSRKTKKDVVLSPHLFLSEKQQIIGINYYFN